jgi:hypothetical protein
MPCSFCPGRGVLVVLNEHHLGVVHQPLIAVVKPGVLSTLLLDELALLRLLDLQASGDQAPNWDSVRYYRGR